MITQFLRGNMDKCATKNASVHVMTQVDVRMYMHMVVKLDQCVIICMNVAIYIIGAQ